MWAGKVSEQMGEGVAQNKHSIAAKKETRNGYQFLALTKILLNWDIFLFLLLSIKIHLQWAKINRRKMSYSLSHNF